MVDLPHPAFPRPDASVRQADAADAASLAAVTLASWREQYAAVLPPAAGAVDVDELAARWRAALVSDGGPRVLVACSGATVVGLVVVAPASDPDLDATSAEVVELVVAPGSTREGHGSRLLAAAVDHARGAGAVEVVTWCGSTDDPRRAFLESTGLRPDGATRTLDDGRGGGWHQVRLAASLAEG